MAGFASFDRNLSIDQAGSAWDFGGGTWNVNLAGSGTAYQTASATPSGAVAAGAPSLLLIALAVGAAWYLLK